MSERDEQQFSVELLRCIRNGTQEKALRLLNDRDIHEIWCDKAVAVYMACGEEAKARAVITWAKDNARDIVSYRRCLLEYSKYVLRAYEQVSPGKGVRFGQAQGEERDRFLGLINLLSPIVDHIKANERVANPVELDALLYTVEAAIALGQADTLRSCGSLLGKYDPIPLEYVKLVLSHLVRADDPSSIAERLRSEHQGRFEAKLLAILVEAELTGEYAQAFKRGKLLRLDASSEEAKRELCGMLFQISQAIGTEAMQYVQDTVEELLGSHDMLAAIVAAAIQLRKGNTESAKHVLDQNKHEDDARWLQLYSYCLFSEEKIEEGLSYFTKALEKVPSLEMYKTLGEVATKGGFTDKAILAYETVLLASPDDETIRARVAQLYLRANDYQGAEEHLRKLWNNNRSSIPYAMNYAACLTHQGKLDDAIGIYQSLWRLEKIPVEAVVAVAQLHETRHQPQESFKTLEQYRERFWDDPGFLMAYVNAGYASGQEARAHGAFSRVLELQRKGKASPDIVQRKTLSELLEYHRQWTERTDLICNNIARGKLPWLLADHLRNHAAVMGWAIRTQPLTWLSEDIVSRASYSIYATNGYHARAVDGKRQLEALPLPARGDQVVIDLSALITLYHLNLLEETTRFFGKTQISSRYVRHFLATSHRLQFHQLSQVTSAKLVKKELDSRHISVLPDAGTPGNRPYPYVHEYADDDAEHYYRLRDVATVLYDTGRISDVKHQELLGVAGKTRGADSAHKTLQSGDQITIELSTLRTLINLDVYGATKSSFRLTITPEAKESLDSDLRAIAYQEECQKWHDDLTAKMRQFETLAPDCDKEDLSDVSIDSYYLAKESGISVLADDRVIHALAFNDDTFTGTAFGVDCVLKAFEREGFVDAAKSDAAYMQLIRWRYRFLVPSLDLLLRLAKQYKGNPPGNELTEIAAYVHDCMRDPGLFPGLERTDPPIPMCGRLFATWTNLIVKFVGLVWQDADFTSDVAGTLTKWALREFLPSPPRTFIPHKMDMIGVTERLLCEQLLFDLVTVADTSRAQMAVSIIREALGMSEKELYRALSETLDRTAELYEEK